MRSLHAILRRLATVCVGMSIATSAAVAADLGSIPERKLNQVVEETEDDDAWESEDRAQLLALLSHDARASVREQVALSLAIKPVIWTASVDSMLAKLCSDRVDCVRSAASDALLHELIAADGFERSRVVAEWALSEDDAQRLVIAQTLAAPLAAVGVYTALQHLANDEVAAVRAAAATSMAERARRQAG